MSNDQLSIDPNQPQQESALSIDTGLSSPPLSAPVLDTRAAKYAMGVGDTTNLSIPDIRNQLENNQESHLRQSVTADYDRRKTAAFAQALKSNIMMTPQQVQRWTQPSDPGSILEQQYAKKYIDTLDEVTGSEWKTSPLQDMAKEWPTAYNASKEAGTSLQAMHEVIRKEYENRKAQADQQSWFGYGVDVAKSLVPFYYEQSETTSLGQGLSVFGGESIERGIEQMMSLPLPEFTQKFHDMLESVGQSNPQMALDLANKFMSYSYSDQLIDNVFSATDIGALGAGPKLARRAFLWNQQRTAIKQLLKSGALTEGEAVKTVANNAAGNVEEAAVQKATGDIASQLTGKGNPEKMALEALPEVLRSDEKLITDEAVAKPQYRELANRIVESSFTARNNIMNMIGNISRVLRTPTLLSTEKAVRELVQQIARDYPGLDNQILNTNVWLNKVTNSLHYDMQIGAPGAKLFENPEEAGYARELYGLKGLPITIEQQGTGYYLNIRRPISEVLDVIRDGLLHTENATTPVGWANWMINYLRTPEETLSKDQRMARKVATYAPGAMLQLLHDNAKEIRQLRGWTGLRNRQRWQDFERILDGARELPDYDGVTKGRYFRTIGELEDFYQQSLKRLPDNKEIAAYFSYKRQMELDRMFRSLRVYTNKSRIGTETHKFSFMYGGRLITSPEFDGVIRQSLPRGEDNVVMIADDIHSPPSVTPKPDPAELRPVTQTTTPESPQAVVLPPDKDRQWQKALENIRFTDKNRYKLEHIPMAENTRTARARLNMTHNFIKTAAQHRDVAEELSSEAIQALSPADRALYEAHRSGETLKGIINSEEHQPLAGGIKDYQNKLKALDEAIGAGPVNPVEPERIQYKSAGAQTPQAKARAAKRAEGFIQEHRLEDDTADKIRANWDRIERNFKEGYGNLKGLMDEITQGIGTEEGGITEQSIQEYMDKYVGSALPEEASAEWDAALAKDDEDWARAKATPGEREGEPSIFDKKTLLNGEKIPTDQREYLEDGIKKGIFKIIELWDPDSKPFRGFYGVGNERVRYVVVRNAETRPIKYDQVPRRGGGHFDYDYEHYIKQAKIEYDSVLKRYWYTGDSTVMPISNRAMGGDIAAKMDIAREMLRKGEKANARDYVKSNLHIPWSEFQSWFNPQKNPETGEIMPARLSLTDRFHVIPQDKLVIDVNKDLEREARFLDNQGKSRLLDGTKRGSLARQYQVAYTGERDSWEVHTLNDVGSKGNPIYQYVPAKKIDPIPSMNRALTRITNSTFGDDYKIFAMEHWLQEAAPFLKASDGEIRSAPFAHFFDPDFKPGVPAEIKGMLEANHFKIRQFTGIQNKYDTLMHSMSQRLADSIYDKFGGRTAQLVPTWMMQKTKDPWVFTRSAVFNMKMGFFNPAQFAVHMMTFANVVGIAGPKNAGIGITGAILHGLARMTKDPGIIDHLDRIASKMGYRPGEWKEAMEHSAYTGFFHEHGEYALRDDVMSPQVVKSGVGNFLDSGQMFFRGGVRSLRAGSWYVAYKEFRDLHPTGALTMMDRQSILERADILSHNMSRASSSIVHTGIMSSSMQFGTYFLRLTELMTGKRLTGIEKARLFMTNMVLFGFPTSLGLFGSPFEMTLRQAAKDPANSFDGKGYIPGESWFQTMFMEGVLSEMQSFVTGELKNVGPRYGPEGFAIADAVMADKPFWQVVGGASASTLVNMFHGASSFVGWAVSNMATLGHGSKLTHEDMIEPFKEISTVNAGIRLYMALKYGEWVNKNEDKIQDINKPNAIFNFLTGLQSTAAADVYGQYLSIQAQKDGEKAVAKEFIKQMRRGFRAASDGDNDQAQSYFTKAWAAAEYYPHERVPELMSEATRGNEALVNRLNWDQFMRQVSEDKKMKYFEQMQRIQQLKPQGE